MVAQNDSGGPQFRIQVLQERFSLSGPAIVARLNDDQLRQATPDFSYPLISIGDLGTIPHGQMQGGWTEEPILPSQVEFYSTGDGGAPCYQERVGEPRWKKGPPQLEVTIESDNVAKMNYRDAGRTFLTLPTSTQGVLRRGLTDLITCDATGNYQIPTMPLIEKKIAAALKRAGEINDGSVNYSTIASGKRDKFYCQELDTARRLALRLGVDISVDVETVGAHYEAFWERAFLEKLPEILDNLEEDTSDAINMPRKLASSPRHNFRDVANYLFELSRAPGKLSPKLKEGVARIGVLTNLAGEAWEVDELEDCKDRVAMARIELSNKSAKYHQELEKGEKWLRENLARAGFTDGEIELIKANTTPRKKPVDMPF